MDYLWNGAYIMNPSQQIMTSLGGGPIGGHLYTTTGAHSWTAPEGVTKVSVLCIGAGGSGNKCSGGGLGYINSYTVIPGNSYSVTVGAGGASAFDNVGYAGGDSSFVNTTTVKGGGGSTAGGTHTGDGGGDGGAKGGTRAGGGAGGYAGNGGAAGVNESSSGSTGAGGGAGGGSGGYWHDGVDGWVLGAPGGGVGVYGQGSSGAGGTYPGIYAGGDGGDGGSGGANGTSPGGDGSGSVNGAIYGGGAGGFGLSGGYSYGLGGKGAVRIIWGTGREFPSTNVTQDFAGITEGLN